MARLSDDEIRIELANRTYRTPVIRPQIVISEPPTRVLNCRVVLADDAPGDLRSVLSTWRPRLPNFACDASPTAGDTAPDVG